MSQDIKNAIIDMMKKNVRIEYTIPDVMKGVNVQTREYVVIALTELQKDGRLAIRSRGKTKLYHLAQ
jgi:hypothetical protein